MNSQFPKDLTVPVFKVRYFAYNCLEMKIGSKTLVVDPCLVKEGRFASGFDENDLEACDYVFVNHTHGDHVATLGKVYDRFHPLILAHASVAFDMAQLYDIPYIQTIPYTAGDTFNFGDFKLDILHARHALNNMIRPSGREDSFDNVFAKPGGFKLTYTSELDKKVSDMGTLFNSNFLMTLANNFKVGFFAGNPGMTAAEDRNMWASLHPDLIFAHRAKYTVDYANLMADVLEITGARILIPIHIEDAYKGMYDPVEYTTNVNQACAERGIQGRMMFLEKGEWYSVATNIAKA